MENFFILAWTGFLLFARDNLTRALGGASTAALLTLTRPDGLLFSVATLALNLWLALAGPGGRARWRSLAAGILPFTIVAAHQAWRLRMYGEWLPNTYYAKVIDAWPESGFRYLLSFVLEYALWFPAVFMAWACARCAGGFLAGFLARLAREPARTLRAPETLRAVTRTAVVATLGAHALYYVVVVGGDHFEYRVFSHLPPLVFAGLVWAADRLTLRPARANLILAAALALSLPLPWSHWWLTRNLDTRRQTFTLRMPVAPHWPRLFRPYAALFDDTQDWLIQRLVCCRHQEHKIFCLDQLNHYPPREEGMKLSGADLPVLAEWCVGVPAWMLPHVVIIDRLGLNDHVIARTPPPRELNRRMAHGRMPPEGYVESFRPNVAVEGHRAVVQPRAVPLTAGEIQDLEKSWRAKRPGAAP